MSLRPGTTLNERYLVETILGEGGMGAVYRAQDTFRGKQLVAVKEFRLKHLPSEEEINQYQKGKSSNDIITREKSLTQFKLEAQLLTGLDHPNLPKVTDYFPSGKDYYIVMTLIVGKDASTLLSSMNGKPLPERAVFVWMRQVMDALIFCHSKGVIHRDIKPANIILTVSGTVYLVDFGIAKIDSPTKATSIGARVVTPGFSPPEQYSLGRTDARSDIYSLGATLYAMLTGRQPIESINRYMGMQMPEPRELVPQMTPGLEEVILKAIDLQPEDRYQNVIEMKQALSSVFGVVSTPLVSLSTSGNEQEREKNGVEENQPEIHPVNQPGEAADGSDKKAGKDASLKPVVAASPASALERSNNRSEPAKAKPRNFLRSLFGSAKEESGVGSLNLPMERRKKREVAFGEAIRRIDWSAQGDLLAVVTDNGLSLFDRETVRTLWREENGWQNSCRTVFSPDRTMLAAGSGNQVQVWNLMSGERLREFSLDVAISVLDLAIQENGTLLVVGANQNKNQIKVWEMQSMRECFVVDEMHAQPVNAIFSPGGKLLATGWSGFSAAGTSESTVRVYDLISFRQFFQVLTRAHIPPVLRFASGENLLAIGSGQAMNMRNLRIYKPPSTIELFGKDHATQIVDVTFDPGTDLVATIADDGSVKVWDLNDRSEVFLDQLNNIKNGSSISFSPKERLVAVGTLDGVLRLFPYQKVRLGQERM